MGLDMRPTANGIYIIFIRCMGKGMLENRHVADRVRHTPHQVLTVCATRRRRSLTRSPAKEGCEYIIQEGDTCEGIAASYGLPLSAVLMFQPWLREVCLHDRYVECRPGAVWALCWSHTTASALLGSLQAARWPYHRCLQPEGQETEGALAGPP